MAAAQMIHVLLLPGDEGAVQTLHHTMQPLHPRLPVLVRAAVLPAVVLLINSWQIADCQDGKHDTALGRNSIAEIVIGSMTQAD